MTRRGGVRAPARRANACGRSRSRRSRPERREGGTHERPEPRGPGRYPGFTRIETLASGAAHSIGGDCGGERGDAAAGRTTPGPTRKLRRRHEARAMRAERSRQAVRHGSGVGAIERVTLRHPSCQPNHCRGLAPYSRSYDVLGVRLRAHQFHASRQRGIRGRPVSHDSNSTASRSQAPRYESFDSQSRRRERRCHGCGQATSGCSDTSEGCLTSRGNVLRNRPRFAKRTRHRHGIHQRRQADVPNRPVVWQHGRR